ncbi:unnamed protein product, partial [Hapterophycus canaliculatus]
MGRKGKKKVRNKRRAETSLATVKGVVTKAMESKKVMRLWQDAILREELMELKRRLEAAHGERDSLRKRIVEREDQQEAVFDTLKERVVVAQAEIQTLIAKTEANDQRRRREHDDTQRVLEGRIDGIDCQRLTLTSLQAELQDKDRAFDRLSFELRTVMTKNEELLREQERLTHVEEKLCAFRRKLAVLNRVGASEEMRRAVANHGHRNEEHGLAFRSNDFEGTRHVSHVPDVPGLGLVPLLMEGMAQFPEDVKLTRDALALLGYVASTEPLGQTFLTTHGLYREVLAALQRHVTDNVVALHAARLLHKSALQEEATTLELRVHGVIPLLAEALAAASYGLKGARKPRRLLYHAFTTIRLCYPSAFFGESLQALCLQRKNNPKYETPKSNNNHHHYNSDMEIASSTVTAAVSSPDGDDLDRLGRVMTKKQGILVAGDGDGLRVKAGRKIERSRHLACTPCTRAPRPQTLCLAREDMCPRADGGKRVGPRRQGEVNPATLLPPESTLPSRHDDSCMVGCNMEEVTGSGYWDTFGGNHKSCDRGGAEALAEQSELTESAVASAVLLRWAVEGFVRDGIRDGCGDSDDSLATGSLRAEATAVRVAPKVQEQVVNRTKSSPVGLTQPAGESKDSRLCSVSDIDTSGANSDQYGRSSLGGSAGNARAAASSTTLEAPSFRSSEGPRAKNLECRDLRASAGGGRERGARLEGEEDGTQLSERDRRHLAGDIAAGSSSFEEETTTTTRGDEGCGGRKSQVVSISLALAGEPAENAKNTKSRWLEPAPQDVALHALVCLLRATEVDLCGDGDKDNPEPGSHQLHVDTAGRGREVVKGKGVLLLALQACNMFQDRGEVVKACCMLMRVGVSCSLQDGGPKRLAGGSFTPGSLLLIENDVENIVTRAAKAHIEDSSVSTEASALLHCLGTCTRTIPTTRATIPVLLPPLPPLPSLASVPGLASGCLAIDAVT